MNGPLGLQVEIDHYGFSGWTTDQLLSNADKNNLADFRAESFQYCLLYTGMVILLK